MLSFLPPDVSATIARKPARKAPKPKPAELTGAQVVLQLLPKLALQPTGLKLSLAEALGGSGADIPMGPAEHSPATDVPARVYASTISDLARSLNEAVQPRYKDALRTAEQKRRWKAAIERDQVDVKVRLERGFEDFNRWVDHWYSTPTELDPVPPRWERQLQSVPESVTQAIAREMSEANRQQGRRGDWDELKRAQLYVDPVTRTRFLVVTYHKDGYGHDHYAVKLDRVGPFAFDYPQGDPEVDYAHLTRRGDLPARDHQGWLCAAPMVYLSGQRWAGDLPWAGCDYYHASSFSDSDWMRRALGEYLAPYHRELPPAEDFIPTSNWPHIAQGLSAEQLAMRPPARQNAGRASAAPTVQQVAKAVHQLELAVDEPERLTPAVLRVLRAAGWREGDPAHDPRADCDNRHFDAQAVVSDLSGPGFDLAGEMWR